MYLRNLGSNYGRNLSKALDYFHNFRFESDYANQQPARPRLICESYSPGRSTTKFFII